MINLIAIIMLFLFPIETNRIHFRLPRGYEPAQVRVLPDWVNWLDTKQKVDTRIWWKVQYLISDARSDGMCLVVSSGYRSYEEQDKLYSRASGDVFVEKPGESEHQTGLAIDFQACPMSFQLGGPIRDDSLERPELANSFDTLPEYQWLLNNAEDYGIVQTYSAEPWHWKFNIEL